MNATTNNPNGTNGSNGTLPSAKSPNLHLAHPTLQEKRLTWNKNASDWGKALSLADYIEREETLCTASSLACDGGLTHWVLVDKDLPADQRPILGSCESIRKRTLLKSADSDEVKEAICHGIGSVFCYPEYRGHGYASRMMRELGEVLKTWQGTEDVPVAFSTLYSDIGKQFYTAHGWHPFPSTHVEFPAACENAPIPAKTLTEEDLATLCQEDEEMIKKSLLQAKHGKTYVAIAPDMAHIEWHRAREIFLTEKLFGKVPDVRGALVGEPGSRVWAIWTRSYYGPVEDKKVANTLHILRLVIEDEEPESQLSGANGEAVYDEERLRKQAEKLKAVVQAAQKEAREWKARHVELWNPSGLVKQLVQRIGIEHSEVEREKESIASIMWYGAGTGKTDEIEWVKNEKYGWC